MFSLFDTRTVGKLRKKSRKKSSRVATAIDGSRDLERMESFGIWWLLEFLVVTNTLRFGLLWLNQKLCDSPGTGNV